MRKLIAIFIVGSMALGLLIAGCGGGGDDSSETEQIDKATFVKEANKICEKASGRLAAEIASVSTRESTKPGYDYTEAQIAIVKDVLIPRIEEELQGIRALGIPDEAKHDAEAFLEAYQQAVANTKAKMKAVAEGSLPYEPVELAGTKFGVSECPIAPVKTG